MRVGQRLAAVCVGLGLALTFFGVVGFIGSQQSGVGTPDVAMAVFMVGVLMMAIGALGAVD